MSQSSTYLNVTSYWLLSAALASCSSEKTEPLSTCASTVYSLCWILIEPSPMYSAYDGVHEYSVTPWLPPAASPSTDSDPILASTVTWEVDESFVTAAPFSELPGGTKLTTKRAGATSIKVTGSTISGARVTQRAALQIAQAKSQDWEIGNERYESGDFADWKTLARSSPVEDGTCGLPFVIDFPTTAACTSCHDGRDNLSLEYTPTQTARFSDRDLLNIVTTGAKPAGDSFESPALRDVVMPDCVFAAFHTFELNEPEKQGMVLKLRSLPPRVIE